MKACFSLGRREFEVLLFLCKSIFPLPVNDCERLLSFGDWQMPGEAYLGTSTPMSLNFMI